MPASGKAHKEIRMKLIIGLLAAAGLTGCVGYGGGYYDGGTVYGGAAPYYGGGYYESAPVYIYGSGGYSRGYRHDGRSYRDRDRDGIPNRYDRDRDGDGVSNRRDAYPSDPRRY
jgi:hypothetical protein